ncbi:hypothetical protein G744_04889 [Escherichia coli HVH 82 (4-2209276)]|nr:hypothetical protein G744_04889 [Escherichia coli HVH 82 (4-2209276)]
MKRILPLILALVAGMGKRQRSTVLTLIYW